MPMVSIIVPAYNSERYLQRCLTSLAAQTMPDFEVIVVNDGSTDETALIADSFAAKDSRFHVIHQENKGVSAARQAALDHASGEYTIHVDSDDWINPEMLEHLVSRAREKDAGMVICDFIVHFEDGGEEIWRQDPGSSDHWGVLGKTFHDLYGSLCNKLIKRSYYSLAGVRLDESMHACEDLWVVLSLLTHPIRIAYLGEALYHYDRTQNNSSLVNANPLIKERLHVLEKYASSYDVSPVQRDFDNAVAHLAYDALFYSEEAIPDYKQLFGKHRRSILNAKGLPLYVNLLSLLGSYGIRIPVMKLKRILHPR